MGFSQGFEKVAFIMPLIKGIGSVASKAVGAGIKGFGAITGSGAGAMGAVSAGLTAQQTLTDYKKNKNLALGAMQRV